MVISDSNISKNNVETYENERAKIISKDKQNIITEDNIIKFYNDNKKSFIMYYIYRIISYICCAYVLLFYIPVTEDFLYDIGIYKVLSNFSSVIVILLIFSYFLGRRKYKKMEHYYSYFILDIRSDIFFEEGYLFADFLYYVTQYVLKKRK